MHKVALAPSRFEALDAKDAVVSRYSIVFWLIQYCSLAGIHAPLLLERLSHARCYTFPKTRRTVANTAAGHDLKECRHKRAKPTQKMASNPVKT